MLNLERSLGKTKSRVKFSVKCLFEYKSLPTSLHEAMFDINMAIEGNCETNDLL
jgi:hypothetical protein